MSFIDEIKKYKETKAFEKKKECVDMIKRKIRESIDKDPLNKYIILLHDDEFKEEMRSYITEYLSRKGFNICEYQRKEPCEKTGYYTSYTIGIALLSKDQELPHYRRVFSEEQ